jgi:hypothetical protein
MKLNDSNAKQYLNLTLASKNEFYDSVAYMVSDVSIGARAKAFYKLQLQLLDEFIEDIDEEDNNTN